MSALSCSKYYTRSGLMHSPEAALWKSTKKPSCVLKGETGTKEQTFSISSGGFDGSSARRA